MQAWEETFAQLREQYVRRSKDRLDQIAQLIKDLGNEPGNSTIVDRLKHNFHWLTGSGSIYGFPKITQIGSSGEQYCEVLLQEKQVATTLDCERFQGLLDGIRAEFSIGQPPEPQPVQGVAPQAETKTEEGPKIDLLVVDGDQSDLFNLSRHFEDEGMNVRTARSVSGGMTALAEEMPDAVVLSIPLPDGQGYELVEHIRSQQGGDRPPVLIVSRQTGFLDKVQAIHCGADGFFEKTSDWEDLTARLRYLLEKERPEPYRILSVEDDPDQAAFLRAVLELAGYKVRLCSDPKRFEQELAEYDPDLVLMDILLPGITGYELTQYVRQHERYATLPVVFLTTQGQLDAKIKAAKSGGDDHLVKPVLPPLLCSTVAAKLERSRFLKSLLHRDGLTKLLTHTAFMERATAVVADRKRHPERFAAMIMIDVDGLKKINDTYGPLVGDKVLVSLATLLRRRLRQSDSIGRFSGEEFLIVAEDLDEKEAEALAERLLSDFTAKEIDPGDGTMFQSTFSAGVAMLDPYTMDLDRWRTAAEKALYAAKAKGKNCIQTASLSAFL
jgi:diguanylate cyclase (GGDEF)-like protein